MNIDIDTIKLDSGGHSGPAEGFCAMELVSYMAGEPWSDHPQCASPTISTFMRSWNDGLPDEGRDRLLKPLLPKILNTATTAADEETRAWMATDWLVRECAPAWLMAANLKEHAEALMNCVAVVDDATAQAAQGKLDAAESAARSAAESAARSAAWSAARSAAWSAAWSAARSAARSAAESAARSAAESAAWSAAWSAAESALAPTVASLQESAVKLVERMCEVGR